MVKCITLMLLFALLTSGCDTPEQFNPLLQPFSQKTARGLEIILSAGCIMEQETALANAIVLFTDGTRRPAESVIWESRDAVIAAVDRYGVITGRAPGMARIIARLDDLSAAADVKVRRKIDYGKVRISEVFYDATGADDGVEFIELYNDNDYACDIAGMSLTDGSSASRPLVLPEGSVVEAHSCAVVGQSSDAFYSLFGANPDFGCFTFTLNNSGETVVLSSPDGERVDIVYIEGGADGFAPDETWGSATMPSAPAGSSLFRTGAGDSDTCFDWAAGTPSPGRL